MTAPDQTEGIDGGLYSDEESPAQGDSKSVDDQNSEQPTGLIPKSLLAGKKFNPGDEVVLKIVADHGDEIEVEYAPAKPGDESSETETEQSPDSELESMNEKY